MRWSGKHLILIASVIILALALRLPRLQQRPMHTDEAVHAVKFGSLLEEGYYRYDSHEFHGPTLNYLSLIPARLTAARKFTEIDETTLRIVPVVFGVLLVILALCLADAIGWSAALIAAVLTAVSPAMVFYSRYYIQEMLMVCFTFGAIVFGYRYFLRKKIVWAACAGICLGLMHATKETCIIAYGAMIGALLATFLLSRRRGDHVFIPGQHLRPGLAMIAAAFLISALFYSSFLSNPTGILDSIVAYNTYFARASQSDLHLHPWTYYLELLIFSHWKGGPVWSEAFIMALAGVGMVLALPGNQKRMPEKHTKDHEGSVSVHENHGRQSWSAVKRNSRPVFDRNFVRFIAFYTVIMSVIYSAIPYKTPWNLLGFWHGMILLAAIACTTVLKAQTNRWIRSLIGLFLVAGVSHLACQAYLANFRYYEDSTNPYVYAHTTSDVYEVVARVEEAASVHPGGRNMPIEIIFPDGGYWPLPYYLRAFTNIGWRGAVDENVRPAPVIIAAPSVEKALTYQLYELPPPGDRRLYLPLFDSYLEIRPKVEIRGYVQKAWWDKLQQRLPEIK